MKKFFILFILIFLLLVTGCASMDITVHKHQTQYDKCMGSSNHIYGYEGFPWGTSRDTFEEKTRWRLTESRSINDAFIVGYENGFLGFKYINHGTKDLYVDKTILYFYEHSYIDFEEKRFKTSFSKLYAVEDEFKKTPSIESLQRRYGDFLEENVVTTSQQAEGVECVYKSQPYANDTNLYGLEILIYKNGTTKVKTRDPFLQKSLREPKIEHLKNWGCYSVLDSSTKSSPVGYSADKRIDFTFIKPNADGKYLLVGYSKDYENPSHSYVRAGICWNDNTSGMYDIKGNQNTISKSYSIDEWECKFNGKKYNFTTNKEESARELLNLFVTSEKLLVRHNETIAEFDSSGLLDKMAEYGITWAEIDAALANEEF